MRVYVTKNKIEWYSDMIKIDRPSSLPLTHRVLTDLEIGRTDRRNLPMVWVFNDDNVKFTKEWQMYLVAINYGMPRPNNISHIIGDEVAYFNHTGTGGKANRRDWILMENLENPDPSTDKTRTCGEATINLKDHIVAMLDGTKPPLLKPGFSHPQSTIEAYMSNDRYVYTPRYYPEYFFANYTTGNDGKAHSWPNGAIYSWWKNGTEPVSFFMHVGSAPVYYPPKDWTDNTPYLDPLT